MKLIVGLGNPGKEYRETRHNVGFLFVDDLASQMDAPEWKKGYQGLYTACTLNNTKCVLLKPETYMNLSGKSVQTCASFFKIAPKDIILITDDIDMDFGKIRFRETGSAGGHNGIASIIESLGTQDIQRIKVGIGRHPTMEAADWVLSKFSKEEQEQLEDVFIEVEKKLLALI
ncbi:aminoacyl-tRNA hydrolase [Candidatus Gracilibacteria bacterium]|nr:aminoacyl-tRNA hydrolase [Candidatus Gracilibacteria bacterium]